MLSGWCAVIRYFYKSHNTVHFGGGGGGRGVISVKTMHIQFTEARYSPKSKLLLLFLCKEPPKTYCVMGWGKKRMAAY